MGSREDYLNTLAEGMDGDSECSHAATITLMFGESECLDCGRIELVPA